MAAATQPVFSGTVGPNYVYSITPCRVLDTRIGSGVYAGALAPSEAIDIRVSNIVGTIVLQGGSGSGCPDIPSDATGVFANVIAVEATGSFNNDVGVQPWGSTSGATAVNYTPGIFATNNGIFVGTCYGQLLYGFPPPSGSCEQDLTLSNGAGGSAHLVVDITGFTRHY
jgi:hypothetical protein